MFEEHIRDLAFISRARKLIICLTSRGLWQNATWPGQAEEGNCAACTGAHARGVVDDGTQAHACACHGFQLQRQHLSQAIRVLAALDGVVSKAWEPRVRASFSSPVAMLATACMWWAMLCYQLVALAQLVASHLPFLLSLVEMWRLAAAQLLPLGQASMAVYGLSVGVTGVREATELAEEMRLVRTSSALATFPLLKAVLGCQLSWLFAANMAAEVVAGPMLCVGQALMALGAPGMWGSVYALMMGGILSGISIAAKTAVDLDTASRFGYDEDALPVPHILVSHLPSQMPRCQHHLDLSSLAVIQRRRERRLRKLAWLKAIGTLVPAVASRALREEGERGPGGGKGERVGS